MTTNFESFQNRWLKKCEELKNLALDRNACVDISQGFLKEYLLLWGDIQKEQIENFPLKRQQLGNDIKFAMAIAFHNHDKFLRTNSWWYKLVSGEKKLDLNMFKLPPV